ncbi:nitrite reductase small subunit NirD [Aeromonas schubertii]|uniref:Nitrite reductase small subunit NirD n=1 Tax=Aeromonas schubertii TaxID=652 RepID=A0ABS7VFX7_9GAMM|nr:nitrite reductase small subunit NirD [Aeromonas schubertii]MBZ6067957.1 nitrite reductase small subunit NirD [Aeromonas schubertii]
MTMDEGGWQPACELAALEEGLGRSLIWQGEVVALFRCEGAVYALDGVDPVAGVPVLALGLVGDSQGEPMVIAPLYKQRYSLRDGHSLDDAGLGVRPWPVAVRGGSVWLPLSRP